MDVYSQSSCASDSLTPGQGAVWLGSDEVLGGVTAHIAAVDAASGAITVTATSPDGSTSEFSPCLTIGHKAASFTTDSVSVPGSTVDASPSTSSSTASDETRSNARTAAKATKTVKAVRLVATFRPFCPPVTVRLCAGTAVIREAANHAKLVDLRFKLVPDELGAYTFTLSNALSVDDCEWLLSGQIQPRDRALPLVRWSFLVRRLPSHPPRLDGPRTARGRNRRGPAV
jgi:hypothetical protein